MFEVVRKEGTRCDPVSGANRRSPTVSQLTGQSGDCHTQWSSYCAEDTSSTRPRLVSVPMSLELLVETASWRPTLPAGSLIFYPDQHSSPDRCAPLLRLVPFRDRIAGRFSPEPLHLPAPPRPPWLCWNSPCRDSPCLASSFSSSFGSCT